MNLPTSLRRLLSWLRLGQSPKAKRLNNGTYVSRARTSTEPAPGVPARLEDDTHILARTDEATRTVDDVPDELAEPQIEKTRPIPVADMNHTYRSARDGFPRHAATPRILPGWAEVPDGGSGDVFDRNSGGHHRRLP